MKKGMLVVILAAAVLGVYGQEDAVPIDYLACFFSYVKGTQAEINNDMAGKYIHDVYENVYNRYRNNEFEWQDKLDQYKKEITDKAAAVDMNTTYAVMISVNFENYDFTKGGFPVKISDKTFLPIRLAYSQDLLEAGLFINDLSKYNFFEVERNKANEFVKSRTDHWGKITREVSIIIYFNLIDFKSREYTAASATLDKKRYYPIIGKVSKIEVYNNNEKLSDLVIK